MKFENQTKPITVEQTVTVAHYSQEDIVNLIIADLKSQGKRVSKVEFNIGRKNMADDNGSFFTLRYLDGAKVELL